MCRLTVKKAEALYKEGRPLCEAEEYEQGQEEGMKDLVTGLVGLCLKKRLDFLTGPQIGSTLPVMVINLPHCMPQILIDPEIEYKKGPHVVVSALSYQGETMRIDTKRVTYADGEAMARAFESAMEILRRRAL